MPKLLDHLFRRAKSYRAIFQPTVTPGDQDADRRKLAADFVLADLWDRCGMGRVSHIPGDPHGTAYNEGRRSVFIYLATVLGDDPMETYRRMEGAQEETYHE